MRRFPVWAVVLNHREATDTLRCLVALGKMRYRPLARLVVDNASGPGEVAWLRSAGATVVESGGNLGYAGGNNVGIRLAVEAGAEAVWVVNPDAYCEHTSLRRLVRVLRRDPEVGIVGPRILEAESAVPRVQSDGGRIVWEAGGRSELIGRGTAPGRGGGMQLVDFVPGAAMLVRRKVFEDIGLLPEGYFLYFEETDFCVRAAAAGWKVAVDTRARVVHRFVSSDGLPSETLLYYFVRNRLLFGQRHTQVPFEALVADLDAFLASWRRRVQERRPEWTGRLEELVAMGIEDARAGVTGRREGVGEG
ncbi:MAG: glycosyltransferase family 2 protein [Actinomycetota bacterium]